MDRASKRVLIDRWLRGALTVSLVLAMPAAFDAVQRALDPGIERRELAYAIERQQREGGEPVVTSAGKQVRAVVYTPTQPSEADEAAKRRQFVRWSRWLAALSVMGLLAETWRILREDDVQHAPPPVTQRGAASGGRDHT